MLVGRRIFVVARTHAQSDFVCLQSSVMPCAGRRPVLAFLAERPIEKLAGALFQWRHGWVAGGHGKNYLTGLD